MVGPMNTDTVPKQAFHAHLTDFWTHHIANYTWSDAAGIETTLFDLHTVWGTVAFLEGPLDCLCYRPGRSLGPGCSALFNQWLLVSFGLV
jgi:hypothetical protein